MPSVARQSQATLLFQIDTSLSMNCAADRPLCAFAFPGSPSARWSVFEPLLEHAIEHALHDRTRVGVMSFPAPLGCISSTPLVPIDELAHNRDSILDALRRLSPIGATPTHAAIHAALEALGAELNDEGGQFLVLTTDGAISQCGYDCGSCSDVVSAVQPILNEVRAAANRGIRTFVIGIPGSDSFRFELSQIAEAGGTGGPGCSHFGPAFCHFDLTTSDDFGVALGEALERIIGRLQIPCHFDIPPNPAGAFDPLKVDVRMTDEANVVTRIRRNADDGWSFDDETSPKTIILNGEACQTVSELRNGRIEMIFDCAPLY